MIPVPQDEENENEEQKFIGTEKIEEELTPKKKFIYKSISYAIILIILIISFYVKKNNSLNKIEKIKEINNVNKNKATLSIIINSFNKKNNLNSLIDKVLSQNIKYSEIILTTNYLFDNSFLDKKREDLKKMNISIKYIEYNENTNTLKMRIDSSSRANGDYIIFIDPEELLSFDILNKYQNTIKDGIDIIQYELDFDRIPLNQIIYQPQIYESLFFSGDSFNFNHFHINGKLFKKDIFVNAIKSLDKLYIEQSDKYYDEIMLISLVFKKAETFIKLKQGKYCDRNKCQKELYRSYKYDEKILKDTILFVRFMLEYTGEDKVQEKRMAANVFKDLLISKKVKYYYNSELLKLIQDTIKLYINCDLINDLDKDPIKEYKKSIRK